MVEIRITYETLFDLLRREKNREELQALERDFYEQVLAYLKEKESILARKEDNSYFSSEKEKLKIQFQNIRRLVKELYEKREKKIINIALVKARTGSDVIDTSPMLPCELEVFDDLVALFSKYKASILDSIINLGDFNGASRPVQRGRPAAIRDEEVGYSEPEENEDSEPQVHFSRPKEEAAKADPADGRKIKILEHLPKFMGRQGEILGPYEKDAVVELDPAIADILVKKGRAQPA